jgi:hypothetical protein
MSALARQARFNQTLDIASGLVAVCKAAIESGVFVSKGDQPGAGGGTPVDGAELPPRQIHYIEAERISIEGQAHDRLRSLHIQLDAMQDVDKQIENAFRAFGLPVPAREPLPAPVLP